MGRSYQIIRFVLCLAFVALTSAVSPARAQTPTLTDFPLPRADSGPQDITTGWTGRCGLPNLISARSDASPRQECLPNMRYPVLVQDPITSLQARTEHCGSRRN